MVRGCLLSVVVIWKKIPNPAAKLVANNGCHHLIPTNRIIMIKFFVLTFCIANKM